MTCLLMMKKIKKTMKMEMKMKKNTTKMKMMTPVMKMKITMRKTIMMNGGLDITEGDIAIGKKREEGKMRNNGTCLTSITRRH